MKKFYFAAALLTLTTFNWAQPVVNFSNINPNLRLETFLAENIASLSAGNAGANQNWDYSTIQAPSIGITENVPYAQAPHTSTFVTANNASHYTGELGDIWSYFLISPTKYEEVGIVYTGIMVLNMSANPRTFLEFPYTFNKVINDTYQAGPVSGSFTTTYDAYGTLKLPHGTFNNVIRQKRVENTTTEYTWFNVNPFYPLCVVNVSNGERSITINKNLGALATDQFVAKAAFSVSPNPTSGMLRINYSENTNGAVEIAVYDITGKTVLSKKETQTTTDLDLGNLDAGVYFVKVTNSDNQSTTQKFIKK